MGRYNTGAWCTSECRRIELSYLLKQGYFQKGKRAGYNLSWTGGSSILLITYFGYKDKRDCIRLIYTSTDSCGNKEDYDYRIYLTSVPSNLGKGEILYFVCPVTYERCRVLYGGAYGCPIYKSRSAYQNRLYYPYQTSSKLHKPIDILHRLEDEIEALRSKIKKSHYKGKPTKIMQRLQRLEERQEKYDYLNNVNLFNFLSKFG